MLQYILLLLILVSNTKGYTNVLFTISEQKESNSSNTDCYEYQEPNVTMTNKKSKIYEEATTLSYSVENDPMVMFQDILNKYIYGPPPKNQNKKKTRLIGYKNKSIPYQYPTGHVLRAELYQNKSGVHLPMSEYMYRGRCRLNVTNDFMQTAIDAFAIFLEGDLNDILRLPPTYVLHSARTIAMMNIAREKLAATWTVVKENKPNEEITIQTLELYRPLFKYLNGKEIAKLNLTDNRILIYIGTHADLNRHQVGVVASKYIKLNRHWSEPKYLNLMNNLLCGVPMTYMRRLPENTYLQLTHQLFYHIRACDPLQRRFYLAMMTKSQALGKSYSWNARDVSRLGLLLAEVDGPDLSVINPEAIAGITAHVMQIMNAQNLRYFTDLQLKYMGQKPLNILTGKLKHYKDGMKINNSKLKLKSAITLPFVFLFLICK
ncbi:PREDICTED: uncharacterized protein LOC106117527 isoform X2 [Papilio xuthus]|uniref:Uncharacterized protein LOC106117527 isoform X2 n=1 Tax=Papilio xuthus TaxID=66420 RepID=A0AAJ7E8R9_PAPXU|nr:PREDICTED: uncharacterized protein LOC106117527 isoform X2 [Papilio xuthus]